MRRGHIPGAINHYWQDDLTQEGFGHVWKHAGRAAAGVRGAGDHAGQGHHRLLQQRHRGEPRALHAAVPAGLSPGADLRGVVDRVGRERGAPGGRSGGAAQGDAAKHEGGMSSMAPSSSPCYPSLALSHRDPAPQLPRPPDPPAPHHPLHRIEVVDVLQRILAQQHQIGVVARPRSCRSGGPARRRWRGAASRVAASSAAVGRQADRVHQSRSSPKSDARSLTGP